MADLEELLIRDGMRVAASGLVTAVDGQVWFEPNDLPVALPVYTPGHEPPLRPSTIAVRVDGVDLNRLDDPQQREDALQGEARLSGVWHGDEITVDAQGPPEFDDSFPVPAWDTPPCAPPPGGWPLMSDPDGIGDLNLQWPEDRDGPEVVTAITFRPSRRQLVAVIASTDPDLTRRRLEPSLGDRLCVVASRWTARQVEQVRERLHAGDWLALTSAQTPDETGQAVVEVYVREVVESFAAYARELPDGLLRVRAWLKPARHPV